ncbi:universal stress protein [Dysgonomonas macrotermitis]|uniref:Nucleotide-binding universal stress protein, UspA family n=1 Tax=Dysgonomonas macrotermitis TaxID=1346286 RepID=A0A1M5BPE2_9BACT|nr:universal stress protein [Dysgonomonas macrotermitis]SHF44493.1 Nucleotide-binding universal stress protein, UspA family [Dysgonomonas macrotermitis]
MENRTITIAIHTQGKALKLKQILENAGIPVSFEVLHRDNTEKNTEGIAVKINKSQLFNALSVIEEYKLFSYNDAQTYKIDDGRKRILVAVDFSSYSMKACHIAFSIAKSMGAKVKIFHVFNRILFPLHMPFADMLKEEDDPGILDKTRRKMLDLCVEIDKNITEGIFPSVNYSYSLREGIVEEEIESFIREYKPALLVVGTKGKNNNQRNLLGSVTADIIEMTNVPVLAVPEKAFIKDINSVKELAFFTNMYKRDLISFDYLVNSILPYKNINITLVHVHNIKKKETRWTEADMSDLKDFFKEKYSKLNIEYKLITVNKTIDAIPLVKEFIEKQNIDVVSVNTQRRNLLGRIFIPSTSRKILSSLDVVLLALRGDNFLHPD